MKAKVLFVSLALILAAPAVFAQQTIRLTTADHWQLAATYYASGNGKAVILLHDAEGSRHDFARFAQKAAASGFGVVSLDLRGHGQSTNLGNQKNFKKYGTDNEFNLMVRDVNSAVSYLNDKGVPAGNIYFVGAGLGANVAAKALALNANAAGAVLLSPSLKSKDVITMSGLKFYKNPVLIAVSVEDKREFLEASFIRNAALLSSGEGKVTFLTTYDKSGTEMLDRYLTYSVIQWLYTPALPAVRPDAPAEAEEPVSEEQPITIDNMDNADSEENDVMSQPTQEVQPSPAPTPAPQAPVHSSQPTAVNVIPAGNSDIL